MKRIASILVLGTIAFFLSDCGGGAPATTRPATEAAGSLATQSATSNPTAKATTALRKPTETASAPANNGVTLPLQDPLPRSVKFAGVEYIVTSGVIDNLTATGKTSTSNAYAHIHLTIRNPAPALPTKPDITLGYGDGKEAKVLPASLSDSVTGFEQPEPNSEQEVVLTFGLPPNTTWESTRLLFNVRGLQPAELALTGDIPAPKYPLQVTMANPTVTADEVEYGVEQVTVDYDNNSRRAKAGEVFVIVRAKVTNLSSSAASVPLGNDFFRVIADGQIYEPAPFHTVKSAVLKSGDSQTVTMAFALPETTTKASIQFGNTDKKNAKLGSIDLDWAN
jgi:hypothetical protein